MNRVSICLCLLSLVAVISCSTDFKSINYDEDQCASCKMIISDKRFGAELVTTKGKVFKYDAAECLFREIAEKGLENYARIGVTYFNDPGKLKNGVESYYLVSPGRPSPMGGNLSSYASPDEVKILKDELGGNFYDFNAMIKLYQDEI